MRRLIVNPGTENTWEIPLSSGVISLGRNPENNFPIEHPSISGAHCLVTVMNSGVIIKDLGSTNGTFVNEAPVDEAVLLPGQTIRLGDIVLRFESGQSQPREAVPATASSGETLLCRFHPKSLAHFLCPHCSKAFCDLCVSGRQGKIFCRACSVECTHLTQSAFQFESDQSFASQVKGAFAYPLKGDGVVLLVAGGFFFLLIDAAKFFVKFALIYGLMAFIFLTVFGTGYLTAYLRRILTSSAMGEKAMPDWPDLTDFGSDVLSPFFQLLATVIFCFAPAIGLTIYAFFAPEGSSWLGWGTTAFILLGCAYFPMAFTAVAMFDSIAAVNPLLVIPSILKIPGAYSLTIILFATILFVRWLGETVLPNVVPIPVLPSVFASFFGLYLLAVEMRILGLLYWIKKDELGWFKR
jgi:FHA domain